MKRRGHALRRRYGVSLYVPRRPFAFGGFRYNPAKKRGGRHWHVWRGVDYVGMLTDSRRGYRPSSAGGIGGSALDEAMNAFIGYKHEVVMPDWAARMPA